jgi:hypothetical protein
MRKIVHLLTMVLLAVVLLASGVNTAAAEPQKNQILVPAECNGQSYTFVINGMGKVGKIVDGNNNIVITEYTVTYRNLQGDVVGQDTFDQGNAPDSQDAISCTGSVTTELQGPGGEPEVLTADYVFEGFITPRAPRG